MVGIKVTKKLCHQFGVCKFIRGYLKRNKLYGKSSVYILDTADKGSATYNLLKLELTGINNAVSGAKEIIYNSYGLVDIIRTSNDGVFKYIWSMDNYLLGIGCINMVTEYRRYTDGDLTTIYRNEARITRTDISYYNDERIESLTSTNIPNVNEYNKIISADKRIPKIYINTVVDTLRLSEEADAYLINIADFELFSVPNKFIDLISDDGGKPFGKVLGEHIAKKPASRNFWMELIRWVELITSVYLEHPETKIRETDNHIEVTRYDTLVAVVTKTDNDIVIDCYEDDVYTTVLTLSDGKCNEYSYLDGNLMCKVDLNNPYKLVDHIVLSNTVDSFS